MVEVSESLTRKVADLARLELTDEEVRLFTHQIGDVLKYVDQLQKIDITGVEPLTHPLEIATPLREDRVDAFPRDEEGRSKILKSAPEVVNNGYKVPQVI